MTNKQVYVAIRDAFNVETRQLEDYARIQRGEVKTHDFAESGALIRLLPEKDHRLIATVDAHEIYFHRNSVTGDDGIRYIEETDDLGSQASVVYP
jgi:hypothetical protein